MQKRPRGNPFVQSMFTTSMHNNFVMRAKQDKIQRPRGRGGKFADTQTTTKTHVSVSLISSHVLLDFRCLKIRLENFS